VFQQFGALRNSLRRLPVKPSAQPTLVRTQHLPPHITPAQAVRGEIIAAGCKGVGQTRAPAPTSSGRAVFGQVTALGPDPAGTCAVPGLPVAVEQWLSGSRSAAFIREIGSWSPPWPAGSPGTRPAHGHAGEWFQDRWLCCLGGSPQARTRGRRLTPAHCSICIHAASSTHRDGHVAGS
jgi:hypothetical protein